MEPPVATPFRVESPQQALDDLRERLHRTRGPEPETVDDWSQGVPLTYLRGLRAYWAGGYDWHAAEARLNAFPQYRTVIEGIGVHFLQVRSSYPQALPLIVTHGWPGSVVPQGHRAPRRSSAYGGDPADAFHVVCPSLPGYGFSDRPAAPGWACRASRRPGWS